jgi:5-methylthioribose kinase
VPPLHPVNHGQAAASVRHEMDARGAAEYVAERLGVAPESVAAKDLGGGVSNHVVLVEAPGQRFVLKQSLGQLRVQERWISDRRRIFREAEALRYVAPFLPEGSVPRVLFEDRGEYAFAMEAADPEAVMWKTQLLGGDVDAGTAEVVGQIHGTMLRQSWGSEEARQQFGDQTAFDELRLDPYYRFTAARHPDLTPYFEQAIRRCSEEAVCLVHGDWSPKNLLVSERGVMAIDFEVIHFGDPAFDTAFLVNHLVLKSFYQPQFAPQYKHAASVYWNTVKEQVPEKEWLEEGTLLHLPLLMMARVDGKSPAEYIREAAMKETIRSAARAMLLHRPGGLEEVFKRIE